jgi:hypothetical protein
MRSLVAFGVSGSLALLAPAAVAGPPARDPRRDLDGFAAAVDAAVRRVSRPGPGMIGRDATRGYRVAGFGALFVVAPRSWPMPSSRAASDGDAARALDEAIRHLEQGLRTALAPEIRSQMERSLAALQQARFEMRRLPGRSKSLIVPAPPAGEAPPAPAATAPPPPLPPSLRLEQLQRELEKQLAEQMRVVQESERTRGAGERELARTMERRAREMQEQMEAMRREVERERAQAERELELVLAAPPPPPTPGAPVAVSAPDVPAVPVPEAPMGPAPWQLWFSIDEPGDGRPGEEVVRDVKAAVTALLERPVGPLPELKPDEYVAVAVDFVPRPLVLGASRAQKSLVVKVRKRDLDERRAGRIAVETLRQRIEYTEY